MGLLNYALCPARYQRFEVGRWVDDVVTSLYKKCRGKSKFEESSNLSLDMLDLRFPWDNQVETPGR